MVTAAERPGGLGEQCAEIDPADTRHGSQDRYVSPLKAFSQCLLGFANGRAELIEFSFGPMHLTIHDAQASACGCWPLQQRRPQL